MRPFSSAHNRPAARPFVQEGCDRGRRDIDSVVTFAPATGLRLDGLVFSSFVAAPALCFFRRALCLPQAYRCCEGQS
jgi:hypothetical protein